MVGLVVLPRLSAAFYRLRQDMLPAGVRDRHNPFESRAVLLQEIKAGIHNPRVIEDTPHGGYFTQGIAQA